LQQPYLPLVIFSVSVQAGIRP